MSLEMHQKLTSILALMNDQAAACCQTASAEKRRNWDELQTPKQSETLCCKRRNNLKLLTANDDIIWDSFAAASVNSATFSSWYWTTSWVLNSRCAHACCCQNNGSHASFFHMLDLPPDWTMQMHFMQMQYGTFHLKLKPFQRRSDKAHLDLVWFWQLFHHLWFSNMDFTTLDWWTVFNSVCIRTQG
jgi:hypothetical protein